MSEAAIIATARTPIGRAGRGAFNNTHGVAMAAHVIAHAVDRAGIDPHTVDDVILGCVLPVSVTGGNVARTAAIRAGLSVNASGMTVGRFCASGLQAVSMAAQRVICDGVPVAVAGGVENISQCQEIAYKTMTRDPYMVEKKPELYLSMLETAEVVAARYKIARDIQDEYALISQRRTAAAQQAGIFDNEIVPMPTIKLVVDRKTGETSTDSVELTRDEGNRPDTTLEGLAALAPVTGPSGTVTAGNASQLSDGAAAVVVMDFDEASRRGLPVLGLFRGLATAGLEPDEMGIGPVLAVPKLLKRHGLTIDDIDLWELNEAFACQVVYCRDMLGIPMDRLNVNGGGISIGHPFAMTGARQIGHIALEAGRRKARFGVVTMCAASGMGAAGLIEFPS